MGIHPWGRDYNMMTLGTCWGDIKRWGWLTSTMSWGYDQQDAGETLGR